MVLANEATAMLHGDEAAERAPRRRRAGPSRRARRAGILPTLAGAPKAAIGIVQALTGLGFAASNGEARRKIGEGAVQAERRDGRRSAR